MLSLSILQYFLLRQQPPAPPAKRKGRGGCAPASIGGMTTSMHSDSICEPIDVVRIRLSRDAGATAIVSEFRLANRVLAAWAGSITK